MNGQPTAQNNRECGADGDLPGFRNWDNPQHVHELAELWNVDADDHPALGAAHPRDADLLLRRAGLIGSCGSRPPTRPSRCPSRRGSAASWPATSASWSSRTCSSPRPPARRRGPAGRRLGREDRLLHQRRPHRPPVRAGGRAAGRGPQRPGHLPGLRRRDGVHRPGRRPAGAVADAGGGVRRLARGQPRAARRLHRPVLRQAARRQRHPVAGQRRAPRRHRPALHRRRFPTDTDYCETYGHDLLTGGDGHRGGAPGAWRRRVAPSSRRRDVHPAARGAQRGLPAALHHRPHRLPVPHPHQDRPLRPLDQAAPGPLGGARRSRMPSRSAWPRATTSR